MWFFAITVAACIGVPLLCGVLFRLFLRHIQPDLLALLAAATFLFLLEQISAVAALCMRTMVERMFRDPFDTFNTWLVAVLFVCIVLARVAIPFLIARRGVWLADRFGGAGAQNTKASAA